MFRLAAALILTATTGSAQCGGSFSGFIDGLKREAMQNGQSRATVDRFFAGTQQSQAVLRADRAQGVFQKPFLDFSRALISENRMVNGRRNLDRHAATFNEIERRYGVPRGILTAFWAFETDYGGFQGNFNTRDALVTLAHDCRRPELFRPQVLAAIELMRRGGMDPATTTGAWAGEIGMVQMLPGDILAHGRDGDGDGRVSLKTSPQDALLSGADLLAGFGWAPGQPWIQEVTVPRSFDWSRTGLDTVLSTRDWVRLGVTPRQGSLPNLNASLLVPQGKDGPAFLAYPNFSILFEWNQSFTYVITAAYFATRLEGAPVYNAGTPSGGLTGDQMIQLQTKLARRGHDVGDIDGILGRNTRAAVQAEQARLGLPADAWPTVELLNRL
ncbi:MAG: lytic murein transglycosylase [Pseudomonadota bacterium]